MPLYLLDADVPENEPGERAITHQLYGGDADMRIRQEIVLGIGGLRALRALGRHPTVFHFNEGHAAFVILERLREQVAAGLPFDAALEAVSAAHVFTTHTPVAAGHDVFQNGQVRWFLRTLLPQLGIGEDRVLALGAAGTPVDPNQGRFNMTTLALHGSRFHNGVSRIHGRVASRMERGLWPQVRVADNPIGHVTNGVHLHTFLAGLWVELFDRHLPDWRDHVLDADYWRAIDRIPDADFMAVRARLKQSLREDVAERAARQLRRNGVPERTVQRVLRHVERGDPNTLLLGFARRFATYKRATLLLTDEARLARILGDPQRPAILLFAGKAHPRDVPGQALIRKLYETSMKDEFIGRLIVLEGYDLALARRLVQGCDVWLNNPEYPLEACGTSGQKAGINGAVNVSVRDGWWDEGYVAGGPDGPNGFAVSAVDPRFWESLGNEEARRRRDLEECAALLDILEQQVAPLYYGDDGAAWRRIARNAMKTLIPRYNSARQVMDYVRDLYGPAARHGRKVSGDAARDLAAWKQRVRAAWPGVRLRAAAAAPVVLHGGETLALRALATLNGLAAGDVAVECELGRREAGTFVRQKTVMLAAADAAGNEQAFATQLEPLPGPQHYRLRMRPNHAALAHPFEMGLAVWA